MPKTVTTFSFNPEPRTGSLDMEFGQACLEAQVELDEGQLYVNVHDRSLPDEYQFVTGLILEVRNGLLVLRSADNYQLEVEGGTETETIMYDVGEPWPKPGEAVLNTEGGNVNNDHGYALLPPETDLEDAPEKSPEGVGLAKRGQKGSLLRHVLIPCFSNAPNREHDAVVLKVDEKLINRLEERRLAFDACKRLDAATNSHMYTGEQVYLVDLDDGQIGSPGSPITLETYLREIEYDDLWSLTTVGDNVYLTVVDDGFCYSWDGRREKHAPSETYETHSFTLEDLEALLHREQRV